MKTISIILVAFGILFFSNVNAQSKKDKVKDLKSEVTFSVKGMTCNECVKNVTKILDDTKGVLKSKVTLKSGIAVVEFDKNKTSVKEIEGKFEKSPYKIKQKSDKLKKDKKEK